jgi:hypothetical protein
MLLPLSPLDDASEGGTELQVVARGASFQPQCSKQQGAQDSAKGTQIRRIPGKAEIVNRREVEIQLKRKSLTTVGRIAFFHRFAGKLGVEEADPG